MILRRAIPIVAAWTLGCGALETPDLQRGAVTGRIANARPGAYAYVLGHPALFAYSAGDGTFRLEKVPAGQPSIVLFDGDSGAESVPVQVAGATESHLDLDRPLKRAATVVAGASPLRGARPTGLEFTVAGSPLRRIDGQAGARLFPLPAGRFTIHAAQPGFHDLDETIEVEEGECLSLEVELEVESEDEQRGCRSCGCDDDLACDPADGQCYACVANSDCLGGGSGGTCDSTAHTCIYPQGIGQICQGCAANGDCQSGICATTNGTYCSIACSDSSSCPSGYDCQGGTCTVLRSCLAISASYGATCTQDDNCRAALKDGKCFPSDRPSGVAGYCSARRQSGCPAGFSEDVGTGYCRKNP